MAKTKKPISKHSNPKQDAGRADKVGYRERMERAVEKMPEHPKHKGIRMQVHHIITYTAAQRFKKKIKAYGYNINWLSNLASIPDTLTGACHLGVQPHIGDHTTTSGTFRRKIAELTKLMSDGVKAYTLEDNEHTRRGGNYHKYVKAELAKIFKIMEKKCSTQEENRILLRDKMDRLSKRVAGKLNDQPDDYPLTSVAHHFTEDNPIGCGGQTSVPALKKRAQPCPQQHQHVGKDPTSGLKITYQQTFRITPEK